jgi:tRNA pseudouridine38-40 synthase
VIAERRIRIDVAYDGTEFAGFQLQPRFRTVQGTLEAALSQLAAGAAVRVRAASRTDSGAHARRQVVDCALAARLDDQGVEHALARLLPRDVRPLAVTTVSPRFHAQHDALAKTYRYRLDRSRNGDPLVARYALHVPFALDVERMRAALALVPGRRDWSGFADSRCRVRDRVRDVDRASYAETTPVEAVFTFRADGFLTHMVRNLVGTLLEIGRGQREAASVARILERGDRTLAAAAAPARGLTLWDVAYAGEAPEDEARDG